MLKKTIAATGLCAAIGGAAVIGIPASAQVLTRDGHNRDSSTHTRNFGLRFRHYHRTRNANWNAEDALNRIRLPINSTNNLSPTVNNSPVVERPDAA